MKTTLTNGNMKLEFCGSYKKGDRSAIVCKRAEGNYVVGKNFIVNDKHTEVSWCWGCYDIRTELEAHNIAEAWINY